MSGFIDYIEANIDYRPVSGGSQLQLHECPFCGHSGSDTRVYVGVHTGLGFCHHCEKGFSGLQFVMERECLSSKKAREILKGEDGFIGPERELPEGLSSIPVPEYLPIELCDDGRDYLANRGITDKMIAHFNLAYVIKNMNVVFPDGSEKLYKTKYRIFIPIFDIDGNQVSWQARDTTGRAKHKYMFPPGFKSAEYLFNAHTIPPNPQYLIISEGVFDVFGWYRHGFTNCVCTFGKKISEQQIDLIRRINPKMVLIAWDHDAMLNKYEFCKKYSYLFNIRMIDLGEGKDADECGCEELLKAFQTSTVYDWSKKILNLL